MDDERHILTREEVQERIGRELQASIGYYRQHPQEISRRLQELGEEWSVERALEVQAGALSIVGLTLGTFWRKLRVLPAVAAMLLIEHALTGWSPPMAVLRQLGVRAAGEIEEERFALLALQGRSPGQAGEGSQPQTAESLEAASY